MSNKADAYFGTERSGTELDPVAAGRSDEVREAAMRVAALAVADGMHDLARTTVDAEAGHSPVAEAEQILANQPEVYDPVKEAERIQAMASEMLARAAAQETVNRSDLGLAA